MHTIRAAHHCQYGNQSKRMSPVHNHQWQYPAPCVSETMYCTSYGISMIASSIPQQPDTVDKYSANEDYSFIMLDDLEKQKAIEVLQND